MILPGVRKGQGAPRHSMLKLMSKPVTVEQAIEDLPRIRSKLSRGESLETWRKAVQDGAAYDLGSICQHEARSHMASDLARYLFAATFAHLQGYSPRLDAFPPRLLPDHLNVQSLGKTETIPFNDRFRAQCKNEPATTVVAHIAKDGHYCIHYDPSQCRSLAVREVARLQTFPDNCFFAGNRTEQYIQVGNAVPPLLAYKLAGIARNLLNEMNRKKRRQVNGRMNNKSMQSPRRSVAGQIQVPLLAEAD